MAETKHPLNREQMAAVIAQRLEPGWIVNLGIGIPTGASDFVRPDDDITLTAENGLIGYGPLAADGQEDVDTVNAGVQYVTINDGAAIADHADSFGLIRRGLVDVVVLGAFEVAADGSFANWKIRDLERPELGGIGGAMDLAVGAKRVWLVMRHTAPNGNPRLMEHCTLPVTAPQGVSMVVTDVAVVAVHDGEFELLEYAPGYSIDEIKAMTGAPLAVSPDVRPVTV